VFFYTGKIAGYSTWIILFFKLINIDIIDGNSLSINKYISMVLLAIGLILTTISLLNLGKSTRLGLPSEETQFKTNGLYKISRNPMYVGFDLITISAMAYTLNWLVIPLGIYSLIIYHLIILGEETFMSTRFGEAYKSYRKNVRRYI
jgi:protein-S-isoprenylcysteine O-methyltransferase Ste14